MIKQVSIAVTAIALAYELVSMSYMGLLLGVGMPAQDRCEANSLKMAEQMGNSPNMDSAQFRSLIQACESSAVTLKALVPHGFMSNRQ